MAALLTVFAAAVRSLRGLRRASRVVAHASTASEVSFVVAIGGGGAGVSVVALALGVSLIAARRSLSGVSASMRTIPWRCGRRRQTIHA